MKEYICKIASIDEVITKWNYEIKKQKRKQKKIGFRVGEK